MSEEDSESNSPPKKSEKAWFTRPKEWLSRVVDKITSTGPDGINVYYNFLRDASWTFWTVSQLDLSGRSTDNLDDQENGQWVYPTLFMLAGFSFHWLSCRAVNQAMPAARSLVSVTSASLAIPSWEKAGDSGTQLGKILGFKPVDAVYFSSIFCGIAEGGVQEAVSTLGVLLTDTAEQEKFKLEPIEYLKNFAKRMGLGITLGGIPGAVWQIVYNACITEKLEEAETVAAVALAVAVCNISYAKLQKRILKDVESQLPIYGSSINAATPFLESAKKIKKSISHQWLYNNSQDSADTPPEHVVLPPSSSGRMLGGGRHPTK